MVHRVLVWKPEGRRPLGRPSGRWVDNIKMDLQEEGRGYEVNEISGSIKWGEFLDYLQNQLASQEGLCSME
jgi:hypothetical protein